MQIAQRIDSFYGQRASKISGYEVLRILKTNSSKDLKYSIQ